MALTKSQIIESAPASGMILPASNVSDKYKFMNTMELIDRMADMGWAVAEATQTAKTAHGIHTISFESQDLRDLFPSSLGLIPRIKFMNAHNGKFAARSFRAIFRQVCSNGLWAESADGLYRRPHVGSIVEQVNHMITDYLNSIKEVKGRVIQATEINVHHKTAFAMATKAVALRGFDPKSVDVKDILAVRRQEDGDMTLWNVFNRIQESVVNGGFPIHLSNGDKPYELIAPAVTSPVKLAKINIELWSQMEEVLEKKI